MPGAAVPILAIAGLNVHYGHSHALQGVNLTLRSGVLAVVGRNGMGKTTLCRAVMGITRATSGSIRLMGEELTGLSPAQIARKGVGYVPQGRRLWPSLTVDEHLRLAATGKPAEWSIERVYDTFPRLAERRGHGGAQLSGGEQQMLAIGRALLLNPRLLVMDEPTEGLAPVIVHQVRDMLTGLAAAGGIAVLVIEQNIGVATAVSERVAIMVNGRIHRIIDAGVLAGDRALQQRLLGVGRHGHDDDADDDAVVDEATEAESPARAPAAAALRVVGRVVVAGDLDSDEAAVRFLCDRIKEEGLRVTVVDLSIGGRPHACDVAASQVASRHPRGAAAVFAPGAAAPRAAAMAEAFRRWLAEEHHLAGVIAAGGEATAGMALSAFAALPTGLPKLLITSAAPAADVADVAVIGCIANLANLNPVNRETLANGAHAVAGMVRSRGGATCRGTPAKPVLGVTMTAATTTAAQGLVSLLAADYECAVFDALAGGGLAMERLADEGRLAGVLDLAPADARTGAAGIEARFSRTARGMPRVLSCGGLDAVPLGPIDSVPVRLRGRTLHRLGPARTLMRANAADAGAVGRWIGERLNRFAAPVCVLLPEGGLSALDAPGQPFHDPAADEQLFRAIEAAVAQGADRQVVRVPHHVNDAAFAAAAADAWRALAGRGQRRASRFA